MLPPFGIDDQSHSLAVISSVPVDVFVRGCSGAFSIAMLVGCE